MDSLLREALSSRAGAVPAAEDAWTENSRRVRRDARLRTTGAGLVVALVATGGVLGFRLVHEPGRGEPVPVQPAGSQAPAAP
ncbi:MAG TPA: hypothetical protein VM097_07270 [Mycobacteriales bacterium]|nr:hypothetical protein [Mycobacteriales bacterium]